MKTMIPAVVVTLMLLAACSQEKSETTTSGNLHVLVPESVAPAALDEVREFLNLYESNGARIDFQVMSSEQALSRLGRDSVRFVFSTRVMTPAERTALPQLSGSDLSEVLVAYDAIAVVVHEKNHITKMTTTELVRILTGDITRWEQLSKSAAMKGSIELVLQESSDVTSFADDRLLQGQALRKTATLTTSSIGTLQSVATRPLSLGLVGTTWIDSVRAAVKVLEIAETRDVTDTLFIVPSQARGQFYTPHPANIYRSFYPLKRAVYAYWYAPLRSLASGFGAYVSHSDGQKLFLKRNMVPGTQKIKLRGAEER
jgi:phosphate transport system substrate-binding protein